VRIIELSSFVAVPLAGMTLAQLGAEVIRVDPVGGAADYRRWPVTGAGDSIYWPGSQGQALRGRRRAGCRGTTADSTPHRECGVLITNVVGRQWHSYETLVGMRPDLIHVEVSGRADGGTGVDYTVNAGLGFPLVTGPAGLDVPVNHVLPAWDVACASTSRSPSPRRCGTATPLGRGNGQHSVGERGAGDGGQSQLSHRGHGERHAAGADRELDLRPYGQQFSSADGRPS